MKCMYYLAPTLPSARRISDDLHEVGINDFYVHVVAKDESGLRQQQIHSANYLETLDVIRDGFVGAGIGFVVGLIGIGLIEYYDPFGTQVPMFVYAILVAGATLFGAWEGGLTGVATENQKIRRFHDEIEAGKFLLLVYVRKAQEEAVRSMMRERHPEATLSAVDTHFVNPFASVTTVAEAAAPKARVGSQAGR